MHTESKCPCIFSHFLCCNLTLNNVMSADQIPSLPATNIYFTGLCFTLMLCGIKTMWCKHVVSTVSVLLLLQKRYARSLGSVFKSKADKLKLGTYICMCYQLYHLWCLLKTICKFCHWGCCIVLLNLTTLIASMRTFQPYNLYLFDVQRIKTFLVFALFLHQLPKTK